MNTDLILGLLGFAFVTSITPGPNNLMLMASGANFGLRRSLPHMLGIGAGFVVMVALVGVGLMGVFDRYPVSQTILMIGSVGYMLWLAGKVANALPPEQSRMEGKPITFLQAAAFQWVNPKAWAMALAAITAYAPDRSIAAVFFVALIFGAVNFPCVSSWTLLGQGFRRFLSTSARLRVFNWTMATLLLASMVPLLRL